MTCASPSQSCQAVLPEQAAGKSPGPGWRPEGLSLMQGQMRRPQGWPAAGCAALLTQQNTVTDCENKKRSTAELGQS